MAALSDRVGVTWMVRRDMPEVLEIERLCFEHCWPESLFVDVLRQRNAIGKVVHRDGGICGFMIYEMHHRRYEILNLGVHPSCWRRGIGSELLGTFAAHMTPKRNKVQAYVRESNLDGLLFFKSQGFVAVDLVPDFWDSVDDAAVLMEWVYDDVQIQRTETG